jgi:amino acid adenylation domain-containing protein/non-ribosomal peptide synthase protein (TIGR01720 family)
MENSNVLIKEFVAAGKLKKEKEYWMEKLTGELEKTSLPPSSGYNEYIKNLAESPTNSIDFQFSVPQTELLLKLSNKSDYRLHMILITILLVVIKRYTDSSDLIIGTPIYKQETEAEYINTILPLRNNAEGKLTIKELLMQVRKTLVDASENQNFPMETLLYHLGFSNKQNQFPLSDIIMQLENIQDREYIRHIKPNIFFSFLREEMKIGGIVEYNAAMYEESYIQRLITHLLNAATQSLNNINSTIENIEILTQDEKEHLLFGLSGPSEPYPENKLIHQLFEEQVKRTPDDTAVVETNLDHYVTYRELNCRGNQLARRLKDGGATPGQIVGIMISPSIERIIAIIAVLKAGCSYLPIDPAYPEERSKFMLQDCNIKIIIIEQNSYYKNDQLIADTTAKTLIVDNEQNYNGNDTDLERLNTADDLAYVLYTSGTTGKPKGVMVKHRNVSNTIQWFSRTFAVTRGTRIMGITDITFDPSVEDIFGALLYGATVYPVNNQIIAFPQDFCNYIDRHRINLIDYIPTVLNRLLSNEEKLKSLKIVIAGGERLENSIKDRLMQKGYTLYNNYGPTEVTVDALYSRCTEQPVTLGNPLPNTRCYILDKDSNPVPFGIPGELCVAGAGIAAGYLNNKQQTGEKFTSDPFVPGERMYRTGDRARWLPNEQIDFLGRQDQQVKLRGRRIELEEIESTLKINPEIENVAVIMRKPKLEDSTGYKFSDNEYDQVLIEAFYMPNENAEITPNELRVFCLKHLPEYMIPGVFVPIEELPLLPNGKVDRKALESFNIKSTKNIYIAPETQTEQELVRLWAQLLGKEEEEVGIDSNFFELGGHSLKTIMLESLLHKELNVKMELGEIFKRPTIRLMAEYIQQAATETFTPITPAPEKPFYILSSAQKRMFILHQLDPNSTAYNIPQFFALAKIPDIKHLEETFAKLCRRHETLRTAYVVEDGEPVQKILPRVDLEIEVYDLTRDDTEEHEIRRQFVRPFALSRPPLMRVGIIKTAEERCYMAVDMHHIISDALSHQVLMKDFTVFYNGGELPPLNLQYKDYAEWQKGEKEKSAFKNQEEYWLKQFDTPVPQLELPTDYGRPGVQTYEGRSIDFIIESETANALKQIALRQGITLYMLMTAAFNVLLHKLTGQEDIVIGTPTAGRRHADLQHIIGMFVNTLALRNQPTAEKHVKDFLQEVKENVLKAFENQDYQFEDLVEKVAVNRDVGRNPLFDVMFAYHSPEDSQHEKKEEIKGKETEEEKGKQTSPTGNDTIGSKFDLTLSCMDTGKELSMSLHYSIGLFQEQTAARFTRYFDTIIASLLKDVQVKIKDIDIVPLDEKQRLLVEFNDTAANNPGYPTHQTLHGLFREQVARTPENIAVTGPVYDTQGSHTIKGISYRQLDRRSNRLAEELVKSGAGPNTIVPIMAEPSLEILVAILAVLKTGAAYLPIDPENPEGRISYILEDSEAAGMLTQQHLQERVRSIFNGRLQLIETESIAEQDGEQEVENPPEAAAPNDTLYIIYTSGTTGNPKGVMVTHRNLVNYIGWFNTEVRLTADDRSLLTASFGFDLGYTSLYPPLLAGGRVYIAPKELYMLPANLLNYVKEQEITYLKMTPSLFSAIVNDTAFSGDSMRSIRLILLGGEAINVSDVETAHKEYSHIAFINHYGPTEATIGCIAQSIDTEKLDRYKRRPAIGRPIANMKVYILDRNREPVPLNTPGEICISGAGIARGYFNREALTQEKFVPNKFVAGSIDESLAAITEIGKDRREYRRLYRTGDRGRWLENGTIEFMGRIDQQVKIRGYRIELGEIETRLTEHPVIKETAVVIRNGKNGAKELCAYIVPVENTGTEALRPTEIKKYLSHTLPGYMIPAYFVLMERIPLTPNGKLDRKALPEPELDAAFGVPPRDDIEKEIAAIWTRILNRREAIGIENNFFEIGGHSLNAVQMISVLHKTFQVRVPLVEIFKTPTVAGLADFIKKSQGKIEQYISISPAESKNHYHLSSAQKRMFILQQMDTESTAYNMPRVLNLTGKPDREKLLETFRKIARRHESLRTAYHMKEGQPIQVIREDTSIELEEYDLAPFSQSAEKTDSGKKQTVSAMDHLLKAFIRPFDLSEPPLFRLALIKVSEEQYYLAIDLHHIISDGASHRIIRSDFRAIYDGEPLPPLKLQYKDYAEWQHRMYHTGEIKKQEDYWLKQFEGKIPQINLPTDYPRPAVKGYEGGSTNFTLGKEKTAALKQMAVDEGATIYMVILAIYNIFLSKLSRQDNIIVGSAAAGRRHADLEQIVGIFVNTLAIRNRIRPNRTFKAFLEDVKSKALETFDNQDYQFEELVEKVVPQRDAGRNPIFDVSFAFQDTGTAAAVETSKPGTKPKTKTYDPELNISKFDLTLNGHVAKDNIEFTFIYSTKLFRKERIQLMAAMFKTLVRQILASPDTPIRRIHLSDGTEPELYRFLGVDPEKTEWLYPLTPTQRDIYLDCTINPTARAHRMIYHYTVDETVDIQAWKAALTEAHHQYPILRAPLAGTEDNLYFAVQKEPVINFQYMDLTTEQIPPSGLHDKVTAITGDSTHAVDDDLVKHYLLRISPRHYEVIISIHHIIFDGPSLKLFFEKQHELYRQILEGRLLKRDELTTVHRTMVKFQQTMNESFDTPAVEEYWKKKFADVEKLQANAVGKKETRFVSRQLQLPPNHLQEIQTRCKEFGISLPLYLRSLYAYVLHVSYGVKQDFIIREIFGGRDETTRDYVGCFFHTIPVVFHKNMFEPGKEIRQYYRDILSNIMKMRGKQTVSIFLQNRLLGEEEMTFFFNYRDFLTLDVSGQNYYLHRVLEYSDPLYHPGEVQLITKQTADGFFLELDYNEAYFNGETLLERMLHLSGQILSGSETMGNLDNVLETEKQVLAGFSKGRIAPFPSETPLYKFFQQHAEKTPDKTALECDGREMSYRTLDERSNQLSHYLRDTKGMGPDELACIMMERSIPMVESILATWKTEGAYIPLDPQYPVQRILQILEDSGARVLISRTEHVPAELEDAWNGPIVKMDQWEEKRPAYPTSAPAPGSGTMKDLAYVIYTSGSTGKPKGAMVEHIGMMNHIQAKIDDLQVTSQSIIAQNSSPTFDISVWQFFTALATGGKTIIYPESLIMEPGRFLERLKKERVTILEVVPSYLSVLLEANRDRDVPVPLLLDYLLVTGEEVKPNQVEQWFRQYPAIKIVNAYGPTEASDDITHHVMDRVPETERIPIGKTLQNLAIYIVDENMKLCPPGVKGEICVSGVGVGRGYLKDPEKTATVFMDDPFAGKKGVRLYKTGDLGMWLPDGTIDFFGRKDYQVKIRGFRIELGEIENRLASHVAIKEAVVIDRETAEKDDGGGKTDRFLCAYYVPDTDVAVEELTGYLAKELPEYMIPAAWVKQESIPLTPNGKVNRKALPAPELSALDEENEIVPPTTDMEKILVDVWQSVLSRPAIGINHNFFNLGGDSIKAIQAAARMTKAGYKVSVKDIFQYPEIAQLAPRVTAITRRVDQAPVSGPVPITPIQAKFFRKNQTRHSHYNQDMMLYLKEGVETEAVRAVFETIQHHHDALRMNFYREGEHTRQINRTTDFPLSLQEFDLRGKEEQDRILEEKANRIQSGIDLEHGPLMKLGLFRMDDGDRLLIVIHHLVVDGISWLILMEDFEHLYSRYLKGEALQLPPKTNSYKEWAEALKHLADSPTMLKEIEYWRTVERTPVTPIPADCETETDRRKDNRRISFNLEKDETGQLLTSVHRPFGTEINDILLAALGMGVRRTWGIDSLHLAMEGHGREEIIESIDIRRTVGWFTSIYPVILDSSHENDISRHIKTVKEQLRRIPNKGIGYGILRYLTAEENKKDIRFNREPQVIFNYLGQQEGSSPNDGTRSSAGTKGNSVSPDASNDYQLNISGMVSGGILDMSVVSNKNRFKTETMQNFMDHFRDSLREIIAYCSAKKERELTPSDMTYKRLSLEELETIEELVNSMTDTTDKIEKRSNIRDIYLQSPMQEGLYFHTRKDVDSFSYFEQTAYRLQGRLEPEMVRQSMNRLLERHEILRTHFTHTRDGRLLQVVPHHRSIDFHYSDQSGEGSREAIKEYIAEYRRKDKQRAFDLEKDVLIRVAVIKTAESEFEFIWSHHHILMDGWCLGILTSEFLQYYAASLEGKVPTLPDVTPYRTYIQWLEKQDKKASADYWNDYLADYEITTGIPRIRISAAPNRKENYRQQQVIFKLDEEKTARLNRLAVRRHITVNTVVNALWAVLLSKYNGKQDVLFGSVVSGRPPEIDGVETMVGLFINTIPVRARFNSNTTIGQLLQELQRNALDSDGHHFYPLAEIQAHSTLKQNLLDHILVFENIPWVEQVEGTVEKSSSRNSKLDLKLLDLDSFEQAHYDFYVKINPLKQLVFRFDFNENVYSAQQVEHIARHLDRLYTRLLDNENETIGNMTLLSPEETQQILESFNSPSAYMHPEQSAARTLCRVFTRQVEKTPEAAAVLYALPLAETDKELQVVTYRELDRKAEAIAAHLLRKGVAAGDIVAIRTERSLEMVAGILGIHKAAAAYLPIAPDYPEERVNYIIHDSAAAALLTTDELKTIEAGDITPVRSQTESSDQPAYVIYTSGSTGSPKGVMVNHGAVLNTLSALAQTYPLTSQDTYLLKTSTLFDVSVTELFGWYLEGGKLAILEPGAQKDPKKIARAVERFEVTHINFVPSMFNVFLDTLDQHAVRQLTPLKYIFLAGEALLPEIVSKFRTMNTGIRLENIYGPTEAAIYASRYSLEDWKEGENVPIGKPLPNVRLYILDPEGGVLPVGIAGQLMIAGAGLAAGYLNNPELTAEAFVKHYGSSLPDDFLYKTGDRAYWLPDGNIQYLGRIDHQVKVRGYRVELGEIENHLLKNPAVKEAVVITAGTEKSALYAYIVPKDQMVNRAAALTEEVRQSLALTLPEYMIPSHIVALQEIPLTPTGKIDRNALSEIEPTTATPVYTAPVTEMERDMANIWQDFFGLEKVGIHDDFFQLGGHSLLVIQMVNRLREAGMLVSLDNIYSNRTIHRICNRENNKDNKSVSQTITANLKDEISPEEIAAIHKALEENRQFAAQLKQNRLLKEYPTAPIQRIYLSGGKVATLSLLSTYTMEDVADPGIIGKMITRLINDNGLMRSVISETDEQQYFIREYDRCSQMPYSLIDLSVYSPELRENLMKQLEEELKAPFETLDHILFRFQVIKWAHRQYKIVFVLNHLISDGESRRVINNRLYNLRQEIEYLRQIPGTETDYSDYVQLLDAVDYGRIDLQKYIDVNYFSRCGDEAFRKLKNKKIAATHIDSLELDLSNLEPGVMEYYNEVLVLSFAELVGRLSGISRVPIKFLSTGRNYRDGNFNNQIGFFADVIPVLIPVDAQPIRQVKDFIDYRAYIRDINLNFSSYLEKSINRKTAAVPTASFSFNSMIGRFENLKETMKGPEMDQHAETEHNVKMGTVISKELNSSKAMIVFGYNLDFETREVMELFKEIYSNIAGTINREKNSLNSLMNNE